MKPRERVIRAVEHEQPDRVPLIGFLHTDLYARLRQFFELSTDEEVERKLGFDLKFTQVGAPKGWSPTPELKELYSGLSYVGLSKMGQEFAMYEEWGIKRKAGKSGEQFYFTQHPLEHRELDEYEFPDLDAPGRFDEVQEAVKMWRGNYPVVGCLNLTFFTLGWALRGLSNWMEDMYRNPNLVDKLLDRILDRKIEEAKRYIEIGVDIVRVPDDIATQTQLFMHPSLFRRYFKPRYQKLVNEIKKSHAYVFFHSDGNIEPVVSDLVEIGIDILHPIQPECMDPLKVKKQFGSKITICTGVSVQRTLPYGTTGDVKKEVISGIKNLGPGGGLIFGTSHMAMSEVPTENIVTLFETAQTYGRYPLTI